MAHQSLFPNCIAGFHSRQRLSRRCEVNNYTWLGRKAAAHATSFLFGVMVYKYFPSEVLVVAVVWTIISGWVRDNEQGV